MANELNNTQDVNKSKIDAGAIVQAGLGGAGALATAYSIYGKLSSSMQGAGAGAAFGPWGALIGGVAGLGAGLFGYGAARNKAKKMLNYGNTKIQQVNDYNLNALDNRLSNAQREQFGSLKLNSGYALRGAYGGPLGLVSGPIDYSMAMQYLDMKNNETQNKLMADGGQLHSHGADWNTGLNYVGNGGSHEENPYEGVPMGIAPDGQPNLVEEGEVIWNNDYVFSKRLKVPKAVRRKYKLGGLKPLSFADAVMKVNKDVEERPNDPIALRGRDAILGALAEVQDVQRAKKEARQQQQETALMQEMQPVQPMVAANGGHLFEFGTPSPTFMDYIDWEDTLKPRLNVANPYLNAQVIGNTRWNNLYPGVPLLGPTTRYKPPVTVENPGTFGYNADGEVVDANGNIIYPDVKTGVTNLSPRVKDNTLGLSKLNVTLPDLNVVPDNTRSNKTDWVSRLRYIPAIGAGIGVLSDLLGWTNKPDYTQADAIARAARGMGTISASPIGDYLQYRPMDRMFALNMLNANAGANRRAILNTTAGNRGTAMAGLLASDNNTLNSIGNLWRQAEEYNAQQLEKAKTFNRATNMFNSELDLNAQKARLGRDEVVMRGLQAAAAMRDTIDQRAGAAKSANLTNLFQSVGDIGWEAFNRNMINTNRALYYGIDSDGHIKYKDAFYALPKEMQDVVRERAEIDRKTRALGGRINKRRR